MIKAYMYTSDQNQVIHKQDKKGTYMYIYPINIKRKESQMNLVEDDNTMYRIMIKSKSW